MGKFLYPKHIQLLTEKLLEAAATGNKRLMVFMPPRHGKSEMVSKWFPAWYLLTHPDKRVMLASYEAEFAASWGRRTREQYEKAVAIFNLNTRVSTSAAARDWWEIEQYNMNAAKWFATGGAMMTAGVGGGLTGKGGDIVIIDDPVKNAKDSMSKVMREAAWDWYVSTLRSRLEPGASLIIVQTRWNEDDLSGRILERVEQMKKDGTDLYDWEIIVLPALATKDDPLGRAEGEALWPQRYNVKSLEAIAAEGGTYWFSALYQQAPIPAGKGIFQSRWLGRYTRSGNLLYLTNHRGESKVVDINTCSIFSTVDLATSLKQTADFTVISTWAKTPMNELILLGVLRERLEGPDHVAYLTNEWIRFKPTFFYIESNGFQMSTVQSAMRAGLPILPINVDVDKLTRSLPAAAKMEAGYFYFPQTGLLAQEEKELWQFPAGEHDDFVDTVSLAELAVRGVGYTGNLS